MIGSHNLWHLGIPFILEHTDHHPPNFRNTWCRHLKNRNRSNFLRLQAHTIQAITNTYTLSIDSTPFWWLLFHLDMLILAPSTATDRSHKSIHATIRERINAIYSGDIEDVYNMAMSCKNIHKHKTQLKPPQATTKPPNALLTQTNSAQPLHEQPPPRP